MIQDPVDVIAHVASEYQIMRVKCREVPVAQADLIENIVVIDRATESLARNAAAQETTIIMNLQLS